MNIYAEAGIYLSVVMIGMPAYFYSMNVLLNSLDDRRQAKRQAKLNAQMARVAAHIKTHVVAIPHTPIEPPHSIWDEWSEIVIALAKREGLSLTTFEECREAVALWQPHLDEGLGQSVAATVAYRLKHLRLVA